jgi:hypothetical protein
MSAPKPTVIDLTEETTHSEKTSKTIEKLVVDDSSPKLIQDLAIVRTLSVNGVCPSAIRDFSSKRKPKSSGNKFIGNKSADEISVVKSVKILNPRKKVRVTEIDSSSSLSSSSSDKKCPVCFDSLQRPSVTLCGHVYCTECIMAVVKSTKQCPICRKKLTQRGFHPLYL